MRVLATMPGRLGDILWALPTVRALSEAYGVPVTLQVSGQYASLAELIAQQPYIDAVLVDIDWLVQETAPMTPRVPPWILRQQGDQLLRYTDTEPNGYDAVYHLGYEGWPQPTLAADIHERAFRACLHRHLQRDTDVDWFPALDLDTPWIAAPTVARPDPGRPVVWVGWSEEWFELKVGLLVALAARFREVNFWWLTPVGGRYLEVDRYVEELWVEPDHNRRYHRLGPNVHMVQAGWVQTAAIAALADCYLGCLSSQWVLANGLGKPTVVIEPNSQRHHPVFYYDHARNHLVKGNDGLPTFDARHAGDVLQQVLEGVQRG